jgi:hypothetical protein
VLKEVGPFLRLSRMILMYYSSSRSAGKSTVGGGVRELRSFYLELHIWTKHKQPAVLVRCQSQYILVRFNMLVRQNQNAAKIGSEFDDKKQTVLANFWFSLK